MMVVVGVSVVGDGTVITGVTVVNGVYRTPLAYLLSPKYLLNPTIFFVNLIDKTRKNSRPLFGGEINLWHASQLVGLDNYIREPAVIELVIWR